MITAGEIYDNMAAMDAEFYVYVPVDDMGTLGVVGCEVDDDDRRLFLIASDDGECMTTTQVFNAIEDVYYDNGDGYLDALRVWIREDDGYEYEAGDFGLGEYGYMIYGADEYDKASGW